MGQNIPRKRRVRKLEPIWLVQKGVNFIKIRKKKTHTTNKMQANKDRSYRVRENNCKFCI